MTLSVHNFVLLGFLALQILTPAHGHLHEYVSYFEPLSYDKDDLISRHDRLRRSPSLLSQEDKTLKLSFTAFSKEFQLLLQPDTKDFKLMVNGKTRSEHFVNPFYYTGYNQQDGSYVHGSLAYGVFDGTIHGNDEVYYIEPSNRYYTNVSHHSVIYRQSDTIQYTTTAANGDSTSSTPSFCGVGKNSNGRPTVKRSTTSTTQQQINTRQSGSSLNVRCQLNVIIDHFFYNALTSTTESNREAKVTGIVKNVISAGSTNFQRTDFNGDGTADNIQFGITSINVITNTSGYEYLKKDISNEFIGVEALLIDFSKNDFKDYCLSYLFTYRDFEQGVLGLAYVAALNARGGACSETENTGVVTLLNYGKQVPQSTAQLIFTHEAGHNFGSSHDPEEGRPECRGSTNVDNHYVMFSKANEGSKQSNNDDFSQCSIDSIQTILENKAQSGDTACLKHADDNCGNFLIDPGEQCDCGIEYNKENNLCYDDPCCNGTSCRLSTNETVQCSPQQGPCCNTGCQLIPASIDMLCRDETECAFNQTCNGSSAYCPKGDPKLPPEDEYGISCNDGANYCEDGECTGSICIPLQMQDCECTEEEYLCHVCCRQAEGRPCTSTFLIAEQNQDAQKILPDGKGQVKGLGFPCNNSYGYCDPFDVCRLANSAGSIKRLTEFLQGSTALRSTVNYLQQYYWAGIVGVVGVLIIAFIVVAVCHCVLPRPKHVMARLEKQKKRRASKRTGTTQNRRR